jgi:CRISPR-associated protein Cas2
MPATTIITRNAPDRFRGFLASVACEVAPGVFVSGNMNRGVREQVWHVMQAWYPLGADYSIIMTWPDRNAPGGLLVQSLGAPPYTVIDVQGVSVVRRNLTLAEHRALLTTEDVPF